MQTVWMQVYHLNQKIIRNEKKAKIKLKNIQILLEDYKLKRTKETG